MLTKKEIDERIAELDESQGGVKSLITFQFNQRKSELLELKRCRAEAERLRGLVAEMDTETDRLGEMYEEMKVQYESLLEAKDGKGVE